MELPVSRSMIVPLIVASALFMENLDGTIITTAPLTALLSGNQAPARHNARSACKS